MKLCELKVGDKFLYNGISYQVGLNATGEGTPYINCWNIKEGYVVSILRDREIKKVETAEQKEGVL